PYSSSRTISPRPSFSPIVLRFSTKERFDRSAPATKSCRTLPTPSSVTSFREAGHELLLGKARRNLDVHGPACRSRGRGDVHFDRGRRAARHLSHASSARVAADPGVCGDRADDSEPGSLRAPDSSSADRRDWNLDGHRRPRCLCAPADLAQHTRRNQLGRPGRRRGRDRAGHDRQAAALVGRASAGVAGDSRRRACGDGVLHRPGDDRGGDRRRRSRSVDLSRTRDGGQSTDLVRSRPGGLSRARLRRVVLSSRAAMDRFASHEDSVKAAPCLLAILSGSLACRVSDRPIRVGSKNFSESVLLGEVAAQALEHEGLRVDRRLNLGGTFVCHRAMVAGEIDLYPEYTGTALTEILREKLISDPGAVRDRVAKEYGKRWRLAWSAPLGFENTFALIVRGEDARQLALRTISDLASHAENLRPGFGYEFIEREDGFKGLARAYGLHFGRPPAEMDLGLLYPALESRKVDVIAGNSTDGLIAAMGAVVLEDDRRYFPPY